MGNMQHQLQHKPIQDQATLAVHAIKNADLERKKSVGVDEPDHFNVSVGRDGRQSNDRPRQKNKSNPKKRMAPNGNESPHPYKGRHIDLSM